MKILLGVCLACVVLQASAQSSNPSPASIRVTGEAVASAKPERVLIDVGVLTQEKQSQAAVAQNAKQLDAIVTALRSIVDPGTDISPLTSSLNPEYQYRPGGGKSSITGYTAINTVRVTLDDPSKVGIVIDAATQAGANHVQSVLFTVRDPQALRARALREATQKARADADAIAAALDLKITRISSAERLREVAVPLSEVMDTDLRPGSSNQTTAVQPDSNEVTATVTLTVEVAPR